MKKEYPRIFTIARKHGFNETYDNNSNSLELYDNNSNSLEFENENYTLYIELKDELFYAYIVDEYSLDQIAKILTYDYVSFQYELEKILKKLEPKDEI